MFPPPLPAAARRATAADRAPAAAPPRLRVGAGAEGPDRTGPDRTEPNRPGEGARRSLWVSPGKGSGYVPVLSQNDWLTPPPLWRNGGRGERSWKPAECCALGGWVWGGEGESSGPISSRFPELGTPAPHSPAASLVLGLPCPLPIFPQPLCTPAAPTPPPAPLLQAVLPQTSPWHLSGVSPPNLLPAALSPRAVLVALRAATPPWPLARFFTSRCSGISALVAMPVAARAPFHGGSAPRRPCKPPRISGQGAGAGPQPQFSLSCL